MNEQLAELEAQVARTADWWNSLPIERFEREQYRLAADQIRNVMQQMIEIQSSGQGGGVIRRPMEFPIISAAALGAQLRVIGAEFCAWLADPLSEQLADESVGRLAADLRGIRQ